MAKESKFYLDLELAELHIAHGQIAQARQSLKAMQPQTIEKPIWAGKLAQLLMKTRDVDLAIDVVDASQTRGIEGNAGDYADQVSVLYQAGLKQQTQDSLNHPQIVPTVRRCKLARARNVYVINQADTLREQGQYAPAYDMLTAACKPTQQADLMLAMGRLYQSGKLNDQQKRSCINICWTTKDTGARCTGWRN